MEQLSALDLRAFITKAVNGVFATMLSLEVAFPEMNGQPILEGERVVGSVSFAGKVMGNISIQVDLGFARVMTAAMLGMELDEVTGEDDVNDVIGEMSNMVGGDLKSRLCDNGLHCDLSIPSITIGNSFRIECRDWEKHEQVAFRHEQHAGMVEVCIKNAI
jgi:CheY-specific phosphatase CheX